jgi:Uma2 family endonuclease
MRTAALLTAEDFALVAPVLGPCELVKGEIVRMSPGGIRHSRVTGKAFSLLDAHCRPRKLGRILTGEAGVIVARRPDTVRGADVAFISYDRLSRDAAEDGFLQQPPELVIEVLAKDASWEKMDEKVAEYHAFGVDLVWVLDPHTLTVRAYPRNASPQILRDTDTATADPHVPGFSVRVAQFFEE